jgi:hypothetical protein
MRRAISNKNVMQAKFETAPFEGVWLASLGRPEMRGSWIVYGGSGSGKTTYVMQLCKYLTNFGRVAYNSLEQGLSLSLQKAWERVGMEEVGSKIILLCKESLSDIRERLTRKNAPNIVVIDSVNYWIGFTMRDYTKLKDDNPDTLFVFIAHEDKGQPKGNMAKNIRYDADIKIRVEGYKAFATSRYEDTDKSEGGQDYVIWEQGAREYWAEL